VVTSNDGLVFRASPDQRSGSAQTGASFALERLLAMDPQPWPVELRLTWKRYLLLLMFRDGDAMISHRPLDCSDVSRIVHWLPWSEWCSRLGGLPRRQMVMISASVTS
jgi:hypothetical protein